MSIAGTPCFVPSAKSDSHDDLFVQNNSEVCRAFRRELNATCGGAIPMVEFKPRYRDTGIALPKWEAIPLYNIDGMENSVGFAKLKELAYAKAFMNFSTERELRSNKSMNAVLEKVRAAHVAGGLAIFQRTRLDLEGRGKSELLYRLFTNGNRNPVDLIEAPSTKHEPILFLERAIKLAASKRTLRAPSLAGGGDITGRSADPLIFKGAPYFLSWVTPNAVTISSSYLNSNEPESPAETADQQTELVPKYRCAFDFK